VGGGSPTHPLRKRAITALVEEGEQQNLLKADSHFHVTSVSAPEPLRVYLNLEGLEVGTLSFHLIWLFQMIEGIHLEEQYVPNVFFT